MKNYDWHVEHTSNKLIPRTLRKRLPIEEEVWEARQTLAYWWYRCLALNQGYLQCCESQGLGPLASLYADMGDVRMHFSRWWIRHGRQAFREQKPLKDVLRLDSYRQVDKHLDSQDMLVLSIPLTMRKSTAMRKVGKLLTQAHAERPPLDIWRASTAKRMIVKNKVRRTTIEQLVRLLELRHKYPDDTLNELGERAGIELDLMARTTEDVQLPSQADERRRMTIAVSRQLKQARQLIENAGLGIFPSLKPLTAKASLSG